MKKWNEIVKETPAWDSHELKNNTTNIEKIIISMIDKLEIKDEFYHRKGNTFYIRKENSNELIITLKRNNIVNITNSKTDKSEEFLFTKDNKIEQSDKVLKYIKKELK